MWSLLPFPGSSGASLMSPLAGQQELLAFVQMLTWRSRGSTASRTITDLLSWLCFPQWWVPPFSLGRIDGPSSFKWTWTWYLMTSTSEEDWLSVLTPNARPLVVMFKVTCPSLGKTVETHGIKEMWEIHADSSYQLWEKQRNNDIWKACLLVCFFQTIPSVLYPRPCLTSDLQPPSLKRNARPFLWLWEQFMN